MKPVPLQDNAPEMKPVPLQDNAPVNATHKELLKEVVKELEKWDEKANSGQFSSPVVELHPNIVLYYLEHISSPMDLRTLVSYNPPFARSLHYFIQLSIDKIMI